MSHPRVLHLIGSLERGGTERQLVGFLRRCSDPGLHRVAVFYRGGPLAEELPCPWVLIGPMRRRWGGMPSVTRTVLAFRRSIRDSHAEVVHAHLGSSQVLAAAAAPLDVPIVASRRGRTPVLERPWIGRAIVGAANRRTRLLLCNSNDLVMRARAEPSTPPTLLIRNGVDLSRFAPAPMPSGSPTVVMVANMRPEKGHDLFLRGFRIVLDRLPEARAILVGGGPSFEEVRRLTIDLGLQNAVQFVGGVDDPGPYLAQAHVAALTSPHEGFPNALLEAMACGRPVVATSVGGVPELVMDGRHGRLTPPQAQAFAYALIDVLSDPDARDRMGRTARARACDFGWNEVVERTEEVYERVGAGERFLSGVGID